MAKFDLGVDLDLKKNQLLNTRLENLATGAIVTGGVSAEGRIVYDSTTKEVKFDTGIAILVLADTTAVVGALDFQDNYNVLTDTPLILLGVGVKQGYVYVVSVGGTFLTHNLQVGDTIFAKQDTPTLATHWAVVENNITDAHILTRKFTSVSTIVGADTPVSFVHSLGNLNPSVTVIETATGTLIQLAVIVIDQHTVSITKNGANLFVTVFVTG